MQRAVSMQGKYQTLIRDRLSTLEAVEMLAETLEKEEELIRARLHEDLKPIAGKRFLCLARQLQFICGFEDYTSVPGYAVGKPMMGWTRRAHGQRQRATDPEFSLLDFYKYGKENNDNMIATAVSSEDPDLDAALDEKVNEEVKINALRGPYFDFDQLLQEHSETMEYVFVVPRHGIWEQHGGQQEPTCRLTDNMLVSGHNSCAGTEHTNVSPIVILWWLKLVSSRKPFQKLVFPVLRRISARPTSRTPSHLHR